jgi:phosphohistidine phosphatase
LELFVLRHGEAGKALPPSPKELQRPLTEAGREEIESIGKSLKSWGLNFDIVLTSPLRRAKETAETVAKVLEIEDRLEESDDLKPEGNRLQLFNKLSKMKSQASVLIVGHEPYLSVLIGDIIAGNPNSHISLKKGGMAKIEIDTFSPKILGELKWLLTARQIRKIR